MKDNRRLRAAIVAAAIAVWLPVGSCSDSPTAPQAKGGEANHYIQYTENFDPAYVVWVVPDYYGMCWNLIGPQGWGTYFCDDHELRPKFLATGIYMEAFDEPDFEAGYTVYVEDPELEVVASCSVGYEEGTLCTAKAQRGTWDESVLSNVRWELGASDYYQSGPGQEFFWTTSTPANGGTVQLSYTLDNYISGQRSIPVGPTPICHEEGSYYIPTGQSNGTWNEAGFLQRLRDSSAGDWHTAHSHCATHVRQALCAGGIAVFCDSNPNRPRQARIYADWLSNLGWSKVYEGSDPNGWCKMIGDVAVFTYAEDPFGDGHVEAWDGEYWRSDHRQNSVYPKQTVPRPFTVWRRPGAGTC